VLVDGRDLARCRLPTIARSSAWCSRTTFLFDGRFREHRVCAAARDAAEIEAVARIAHCDEFIEQSTRSTTRSWVSAG